MPINPLRGPSPQPVIGSMITEDVSIGVEDFAPVGNTMQALYFPPIGDARSGAAAPITLCLDGVPIAAKMLKREPGLLERDAGTALLIRLADAITEPLLKTDTPKRIVQAMAVDIACMLANRDVLDVPDKLRPANSTLHEQFINVVTSGERVVFEMKTTFRSSDPTTDAAAKPVRRGDARSNSLDETTATSFIDLNEPAPRAPEASAGNAKGRMVADPSEPDPTAKPAKLSEVRSNALDETAETSFIDPNEPARRAPDASAGGDQTMLDVRRAVWITSKYDRDAGVGTLTAGCDNVRVLLDKRLATKLVHEQTVRMGAPGSVWIPKWLEKFLEGIANYFRLKGIAFAFSPKAPTSAPDAAPQAAHLDSEDLTNFERNTTCFSAHPRGDGVREPTRYHLFSERQVARNNKLSNTPSLSALRDDDAQARLKRFEARGVIAAGAHYRELTQSLAKDRTVTYEGRALDENTYRDASLLFSAAVVEATRKQAAALKARVVLEERLCDALKKKQPFVLLDGEDAMPYGSEVVRNALNFLDALRRVEEQTEVAFEAREALQKPAPFFGGFGTQRRRRENSEAADALLADCESALLACATALELKEGLSREEQLASVKAKLLDALLAQIELKVGHTPGLYERLLRLMKHGPDVTRTLIAHDGPRFPERDTEQLTLHICTRASENFPDISVEPGTVAVTIASGCAALKPDDTVAFGPEKLEANTVDASTKFEAYWLVSPKAGAKLDLVKYDAKFALRPQKKSKANVSTANVSTAQRAVGVENAAVSRTTVPSELAAPPAALKRRDPRSKTLPPHELGVGPRFVAELRAAAQANVKTEDQARADLAAYVYDRFEQGLPVVELNGGDALADAAGDDALKVRAYIDALRALQHQTLRTEEALGKTDWAGWRNVFSVIPGVDSGDDVVRAYQAEKAALDTCQAKVKACLRALDIAQDVSPAQQSARVKERLLDVLFGRIRHTLSAAAVGFGATDAAWEQVSALLLYGADATHELIDSNDHARLPERDTAQLVFKIFTTESDKFPGIRVNAGEVALTMDSAGTTPGERATVKPGGKASDAKARPDPSRSFEADWRVTSEGLQLDNVHYNERFKRRPQSVSEAQSRVCRTNAAASNILKRSERDALLKAFERGGGERGDENRGALVERIKTDGYAALKEDEVASFVYPFGAMFVEQARDTEKRTGTTGLALGAEAAVLADTVWERCLRPEPDAFILLNGENPLAGNDNQTRTLRQYARALDTLARVQATKGETKGPEPQESNATQENAEPTKATEENAEQVEAARQTVDHCADIYQMRGQPLDAQIETVKAHLYEKLAAYIRRAFPDEDVQQRIVEVLCHGRYAAGKVIQGNGGPRFGATHARPDRITIDTSPDAQAGAAAHATIKFYSQDERQPGDAPVLIGNGELDAQTVATHTSLAAWRVSKQETELTHLESHMHCAGPAMLSFRDWPPLPNKDVDRDELWRAKSTNGLDYEAREALRDKGNPTAHAKYEALLQDQEVSWEEYLGVDADGLRLGTLFLKVAGTMDTSEKERRTQSLRALGRQLLLGCMRNQPFLRVNDVDILAERKKCLSKHYAQVPRDRNTIDDHATYELAKSFRSKDKKPSLTDLPMTQMTVEVQRLLVIEVMNALEQAFPDERTRELVIAAVVNGADAMHRVVREKGGLDWSDPDREQRSILICTRPNDELTVPVQKAMPSKVMVPEDHVVLRVQGVCLPLGPKGTVRFGDEAAAAVFSLRHLSHASVQGVAHIRIQGGQMVMEHCGFEGELALTSESAKALNPGSTVKKASHSSAGRRR